MPPIVALLVSVAIFTVMFALGLGLKPSSFAVLRQHPGVMARILVGTCLLVPLAGLLLLELPLTADLSSPARFAIALMVICPSAPLALRRVSSPGSSPELAACIQVSAAILAIVSVPLMVELFTRVNPVDGWDITPAEVALQVTRVQLFPLAAGLLLKAWKPAWGERWSGVINQVATALLLLVVVLLLVITSSSLFPFLAGNLAALVAMALMVAISLAIGYGLAERDADKQRTVALVTCTRNLGLAAQLAVVYGSAIKGLIPAVLTYTLVSILLSTLFLKLLPARTTA
ncbi:bile acid:sodium symporter [Synechococcus sp. CS-602]|uniref:bile acid:sodium symporter family protein n=1 Tax=Synechococcaceae TaxID=1890426 RepID=UPI0008FF48B6|nr:MULTISPECIES: bile acid:sodium symporter [Synechococcaceae]MCT4364973.1 bile acid:sodium symporter [Candidatus Regnicoccus frigidus MAG-AL1]APD47844.1 hypothetical protein BM449_05695 [Synechococcus sp. SynAce01]MCT0202942.1 bile acid:sodium symporter [Synechococcus sp. CS-603]MCT0205795.1 bile acid:sodium symporter [Synechococcus sp. CS-602]MCT0245201.1 bile acid:sodium symporter [Synechococcus sp. CS-601]